MGSQGWGFLGCFGLSGPLPDLLLWGWESTSYRLETEAEKRLPHRKAATETHSSVCKDWCVPLQVLQHKSSQTDSTFVRLSPALERTSLLCGSCCPSLLHTADGPCCPFSLYTTRYSSAGNAMMGPWEYGELWTHSLFELQWGLILLQRQGGETRSDDHVA